LHNEASSAEPAGKQDETRARRLLVDVDEDTILLVLLGEIGTLAHPSLDGPSLVPPSTSTERCLARLFCPRVAMDRGSGFLCDS
jgi:hypothetical protein